MLVLIRKGKGEFESKVIAESNFGAPFEAV